MNLNPDCRLPTLFATGSEALAAPSPPPQTETGSEGEASCQALASPSVRLADTTRVIDVMIWLP